MEIATSQFENPFVLLPRSLSEAWEDAIFDEEPGSSGSLSSEITTGESWMRIIPFKGAEVLQIGEQANEILWLPATEGGMFLEVLGADSRDGLAEFALAVAREGNWTESLEVQILDSEVRFMAAFALEGDGLSRIDFSLSPGRYRVDACYAEDSKVMAVVYRMAKMAEANKPWQATLRAGLLQW